MAKNKKVQPADAPAAAETRPGPSNNRIEVPPGGAVVRMYCTGLGDCFLVAFRGEDNATKFLLIDFGVYRTTRKAADRMKAVMRDILEVTGGGVDVLAVTHEHWDHLSGFSQAADEFAKLKIGRVWMSWAEDADHGVGKQLREKRKKTVQRLAAAAERMHDADQAHAAVTGVPVGRRPTTATRVLGLLGFFGVDDFGVAATTSSLMDTVRKRVKRPEYMPTGGPVIFPGTRDVRVHVLGPPTDLTLLRKSDPSKANSEVYLAAAGPDPDAAFAAANIECKDLKDLDEEDREALVQSFPFDVRPALTLKNPGVAAPIADRYKATANAWRNIDTDWLRAAGDMALRLDNDTNNTSLVLAIELGKGGPVLLFPGDAQVGNWLSWDTVPLDNGRTTAADLLGRTVLYKVGHHASHNATLSEKGLGRMNSPDLIAMIPVDAKVAREPKGGNPEGWDMPYGNLLTDLVRHTAGRILRSDQVPPAPDSPPPGATAAAWKAFHKNLHVGPDAPYGENGQHPLYLQYTVHWKADR